MPEVEYGDIIRVASRTNQPLNGDFVNVYHFRLDEPLGGSISNTVLDLTTWLDEMYFELRAGQPNTNDAIDINIFNETQKKPYGSWPWDTYDGGSSAGASLPPQVAGFVRGLTGYSRNWARKFLGPFLEDMNTGNGFLENSLLTLLGNFGGVWLSGPALGTVLNWAPVVYYIGSGNWEAVSEIVFDNVWATMRRRRTGVGS